MADQPAMMTCDWCGKVFPADARACVETGFDAVYQPEPGEEWKEPETATLPDGLALTHEHRERLKNEMGLDDAQLDELLTTGSVTGLGGIICLECQDRAAKEAGIEL